MANSNGVMMLFNELTAREGESHRDQATFSASEVVYTHSEGCLQGHRS